MLHILKSTCKRVCAFSSQCEKKPSVAARFSIISFPMQKLDNAMLHIGFNYRITPVGSKTIKCLRNCLVWIARCQNTVQRNINSNKVMTQKRINNSTRQKDKSF